MLAAGARPGPPQTAGRGGVRAAGRPRRARHGLVEAARLEEVEGGNARRGVHGQELGAGAGLVALVEAADGGQHPANRLVVPGGDGLAAGPMMDAPTRDIEQVAQFLPSKAGSAADFQDGLGRGLRGHAVDLAGGGRRPSARQIGERRRCSPLPIPTGRRSRAWPRRRRRGRGDTWSRPRTCARPACREVLGAVITHLRKISGTHL